MGGSAQGGKSSSPQRWQHRTLSHVEQDGLPPMPKDRGTGQGNVDGLLEFRLALGMVAAEARSRVAAQQAARTREQDAENPKFPIGRPRKKTYWS